MCSVCCTGIGIKGVEQIVLITYSERTTEPSEYHISVSPLGSALQGVTRVHRPQTGACQHHDPTQ